MKTQLLIALTLSIGLSACGQLKSTAQTQQENAQANLPEVGVPQEDGSVIRGRATIEVKNEQETAMMKMLNNLILAKSYASSNGSKDVTYNNGSATRFSINVSKFAPNGFKDNVLSLGQVSIGSISDNDLNVCGEKGKERCNTAAIRVYTTGKIEGFVNTSENYGVPVYAGALNPESPVGLNPEGAVFVQTIEIAKDKHTINVNDFPQPNYVVSADFVNGGAGSYAMTFVVEYVLLP